MLEKLFKKSPSNTYIKIDSRENGDNSPEIPKGMWKKCNRCGAPVYTEDVRANAYICPKCGGYFRVHAKRRIEMVTDENSFEPWDCGLEQKNPLQYAGYGRKLEELKEKTKLDEAVITGRASIGGYNTVIGVSDARFMMGSMGSVVGEKITRAIERATSERLPVILFCCSGGARMQEGIVSLMQMAKTSAAIKRHSDAGLLYVTVLTDPTTGGVTASFAMLGDIILAEPGALIGFAGPRVIEQTIRQKLPEGFQRSEFLLQHGFVDEVVPREQLKSRLMDILRLHEKKSVHEMADKGTFGQEKKIKAKRKQPAAVMSAWERVQLSRRADRLTGLDYINGIFTDFIEFHGDRYCGDDGAVVGGVAMFCGRPVTVIAQQKGKTTKENLHRNFGMMSPEGYRKALRLMKQAEKFGRPIICFVDTPGAFCGLEAEERGQGEAIARNLMEMSALKVPLLSLVIGEGGSGGALALAVADEVWMMENAVYSVLSPEGFASILWKDSKRADEAAKVMKITAGDLKRLGIIERIIAEEIPACAENAAEIYHDLEIYINDFIQRYAAMSPDELTEHRYERFRRM